MEDTYWVAGVPHPGAQHPCCPLTSVFSSLLAPPWASFLSVLLHVSKLTLPSPHPVCARVRACVHARTHTLSSFLRHLPQSSCLSHQVLELCVPAHRTSPSLSMALKSLWISGPLNLLSASISLLPVHPHPRPTCLVPGRGQLPGLPECFYSRPEWWSL